MKIKELFDISRGSNADLVNLSVSDGGVGVPYVSRAAQNKGVVAFVEEDPAYKKNPANSISVPLGGNGVLTAYFHEYEYYSGQNVAILTVKSGLDISINELIYYCVCIRANAMKYCYGRHANCTFQDIELPPPKKIPKWINKVGLGEVKIDEVPDKLKMVRVGVMKRYRVADLFKVERGGGFAIGKISALDGTIPIVSSSNANNGIAGYTHVSPQFESLPCLSLAVNGSVGACFVQESPFVASGDVTVLSPIFSMSVNVGLYIATLLWREGVTKYSYGRKWDIESVGNTLINLPSAANGPDFDAIEKIIGGIKGRFTITSPVLKADSNRAG